MNRVFRIFKVTLLVCASTVIYVNSGYIEPMMIFSGICGLFIHRLYAVVALSFISGIVMSAFGDGIFLINILANVYFSLILFLFRISKPLVASVILSFFLILIGVLREVNVIFYITLNTLIFGWLHYLILKISSLRQSRIF